MFLAVHTSTDSGLIEDLRAGGARFQRAAKSLYAQWRGYIFNAKKQHYALSIEDIEDAYADAVDAVIRSVVSDTYDAHRGKISTLLYQILSNKCIDRLRNATNQKADWQRNLREIAPELPVASVDFLERLFTQDEFTGLTGLMDRLNPPCKELIMDMDYWGFRPEEIFAVHGYKNARSATQAKFRCMEALRKLIRDK